VSEPLVGFESKDRVATLTLNRPAKKNALDIASWIAFRDALIRAREDPEIHVVLVTGAGGNFCSGMDVVEMNSRNVDEEHPSSSVIELLTEFDKPLFAAVEGVAVGFGLTILLHSDFVYVTPDARIRAPFVPIGLVPEAGSTYLLPLRVGATAAAEIFLAADFFDGRRAVEIGLAQRTVPSERLMAEALARAKQVAAHPLAAVQETKRLLLAARRESVSAAHQRERDVFVTLLRGMSESSAEGEVSASKGERA